MADIEQSFYGMKGQAKKRIGECGGCVAVYRYGPDNAYGLFMQGSGEGFMRDGMMGSDHSITAESVVRYISSMETAEGRKCDRRKALRIAIDNMRKDLEKFTKFHDGLHDDVNGI